MVVRPRRLYHVNVNCSDLERSLEFYRDLLGLTPLTRTRPEASQPGAAFGLDRVAWDAWILRGDDPEGVVLDLLEWQEPPPAGRPATDPTAPGFNRLAVRTPDIDAAHDRLSRAGVNCRSSPAELELGGVTVARLFVAEDPDGTQVAVVAGDRTRLSHVTINAADAGASRRYYEEVAGLAHLRSFAPGALDGRVFGIEGPVELRVELLADHASGFMVELVQWDRPRPPAPVPRAANELGIFRMAWLTGDIDADHAALVAAGVTCYSPPARLQMGPGLPELWALFWDDPDGACLELIESPG